MDLALKQRLVGAIVLVALGVIFIPMLLDGPADQARHEVAMRIPAPPEGRTETRRLPLNPVAEAETQAPESDTSTDTAPESVPEVVVSKTPEPAGQPGSGDATPRARPEPATPAGTSRWLLQVGSFGNPSNATSLVDALKAAGFSAYQESIQAGDQTLYRVRVRGWGTREAALDAGNRIGESFPDIDISLRRGETPEAEGEEEPEQAFGWMVQVGSFEQQGNARSLRDRLREAGYAAHSDRLDVSGQVRFRVRVGPWVDRAEAEGIQKRLKEEMGLNGLVVSHP